MKNRIIVAGALGVAAMVGGVLFPLLVVLFGSTTPAGLTTALSVPNTLVIAAVLLLLPGPVGLYLAHAGTFDRRATAAVAALVAGLLGVFAATVVDAVLGAVPGSGLVWTAIVFLLLVGAAGTGLAIATGHVLAHRRASGALLAVSPVVVVGTAPALSALSLLESVPNGLVGLVATAPAGVAWLLLGYDMLTLENLSIQPTRVVPGEE